jgi:hypothetical protein
LKIHPSADLFLMMTKDELQELAFDIKANGLVHPIIVDEHDQIIDGRNRLAACKLANVEPTFEKLNGRDPIAYIVSANLQRRNLNKGQQAMAIAMLYPETGTGGRGKKSEAKNCAETAQFSARRVQVAQQVLRQSRPYAEMVMKGTITLDAALEKIQKEQKDASSAEARLERLKIEAPDLAARVADENLNLDEAMAIHAQNKARIQDLKLSAQAALDGIDGFVNEVDVIEAGIKVGAELDFESAMMTRMSKAWALFLDLAKPKK